MNLIASFEKRIFTFKRPSGTSRGILTEKKAWFITVWDASNPSVKGVGECSIIPNLSPDYENDEQYEAKIQEVTEKVQFYAENIDELLTYPSIFFGLETALLDLKNGGERIYFNTAFTQGKQAIPINGLIWMGSEAFMQEQVEQKLAEGFSCIKMKIGAIEFETEFAILQSIRSKYPKDAITLRVDANGAFAFEEAVGKLARLKSLDIHSIEQPIRQGQRTAMNQLCRLNSVPIALDEELIGVYHRAEKVKLLDDILPQYIILKPSLHGGLAGTKEWIELAEARNIPWWITSALESNVGLEAIAQFTSTFEIEREQGLGTGSLYVDNVPSNLIVENGELKVAL